MREDVKILLVEDDHVDEMSIKRALKGLKVKNTVLIVSTGKEALEFFLLRNKNTQKPSIILLDLNTPSMNGIEFLRLLKRDEELKSIPVIVLTPSRDDEEIITSFNLGVAGYMVKPADYDQFVKVIRTIDSYWSLSELP